MANSLTTGISPLAQLRDIHLPPPITWWPLAPGWYLLIAICIIICIALIFYIKRWHTRTHWRRSGLQLLEVYKQQYKLNMNSQISAAYISELLKRIAIIYFPRTKVASLQGDAWIMFLNDSSVNLDFNYVRYEFLQAPYVLSSDCDLTRMFKIARSWIAQRGAACLD